MKKKVLAVVLGIALAIQPFSTVIAAELQNGAETETMNEIETNVESQEEIDVTENEVVSELENNVVIEDSTEKELDFLEEKEDSAVSVKEKVESKDVSVKAVEDTEEPVIHCDTLTIDKTEATVGDTVKFSVKASDNTEIDKVIIKFVNVDNKNTISWENMKYNDVTGKYEYFLSITETMVAGHWTIDSIGAYDVSGNYDFKSYGYDDDEGGVWSFYVKNDNVDSEAPVIDKNSLKISKKEAIIGDEILFSVKVTDNALVDRVRIEISKDTEIFGNSYDMIYNSNTGLYEYKLKIDDTWVGHWYVNSLFAYDATNNYSYNFWEPNDDNAYFVVSENGEVDYDCEVVDLKCTSGETVEYSYVYGRNDKAAMRIFDKSIVGYVQQSYGISNIGYEIGGVFTPYKEGKTTVEVFSTKTGKILKVYKIEVSPKEHFVCNEMGVKGTFLTSTKQNYSVYCDNQKIDANVRLIRSNEIIIGSVVMGQYEYEYNFAFNKNGNKKVSIVGETDNKEITLNVNVNSHDYNKPTFTWNKDNSCTATYSCKNCNKTEANQVCAVTSKTTKATCTTKGKTVYTATIDVNGKEYRDTKTVEIPALGHNNSGKWETVKKATCAEEGKSVQKCTRCGSVLEEKILPKVKHKMDDWKVTVEPTCTAKGTEKRVCTVCGEKESREIPALGHDLVETKVEPTCTEDGSLTRICKRCDYTEKEIIPAVGHKYGKWIVIKEATFLEDGTKERECKVCGHVETAVISKLSESHEHKFTGEETITKKPTCTEDGIKVIHCYEKDCTAEITETIPALGHQAGEWTVVEEPTCTEEGLEVQKCTVCNDIIEERTIAKVAHTYNEGEVIREADCVTGSETTFTCTVCGNEKVETGEPLGHVFGEWEVTKEATCTESGEEIRKCERCEETEVREILAKGHSFGEWTITKKPTTEEDGNCERICEVCDEKETKVIAKLPAEDKPEKPSTGEDDEKTEDTTPKTGDMSPIALSVFGMFAAVLLVCSSLVLKKKRR